MVEAGAKEITEEEVVQALEAGHDAIKRIVDTIDTLAKEAGKPKREAPAKKEVEPRVLSRGRREGARPAQRSDARA